MNGWNLNVHGFHQDNPEEKSMTGGGQEKIDFGRECLTEMPSTFAF